MWWASSTPLENGSLARAANLDLFLNSLGPREGRHFYWDESLHGEIRSEWSFASGPALYASARSGFRCLALLVLLSFSRRSGPVRELPPAMRATPIEFIDALGSLYRNAGASSTAVSIAWERFRAHALQSAAAGRLRGQQMGARELAAVLRRRFPGADPELERDLTACETAAGDETLSPREALRLVQLLDRHRAALDAAARPTGRGIAGPRARAGSLSGTGSGKTKAKERAS